jgi:putative RNA 2'-phosphotransferase
LKTGPVPPYVTEAGRNGRVGPLLSRRKEFKVNDLVRFMAYILGRRPDEFGLVPDREGFVSYKELLWVLHEETGFGYVREGDIHEAVWHGGRGIFEAVENRIRAAERQWQMELDRPAAALPKLLLTAVRRKAHAHVLEKGLAALNERYLVLSTDKEKALRIGRRREQKPVMIEIMAAAAAAEGIAFYPFGELFLSREIPARFLSGPPVAEDRKKPASERETDSDEEIRRAAEAGTVPMRPDKERSAQGPGKGKKPKGWKEESRRLRKRKGG